MEGLPRGGPHWSSSEQLPIQSLWPFSHIPSVTSPAFPSARHCLEMRHTQRTGWTEWCQRSCRIPNTRLSRSELVAQRQGMFGFFLTVWLKYDLFFLFFTLTLLSFANHSSSFSGCSEHLPFESSLAVSEKLIVVRVPQAKSKQ